MARRDDLEQSILGSYGIIREYEAIIQTSDRPQERARARRVIDEQWDHVRGYLAEYNPLVGGVLSEEIAQIAAHYPNEPDTRPEPPPPFITSRQPFEPEMVPIPGGKFLMGSDPKKDQDAREKEQPQHYLCLPQYLIGKTPVTNAEYRHFAYSTRRTTPSHWEDRRIPEGKEDHPVVDVSWHDAMDYCRWLAESTGKPYSLPSEAEWEKAASWDAESGQKCVYPWGDQWDATRCNSRQSAIGDTTPVDTYPQGASPYGVLDMAGNVWEWTKSLFGKEPSSLGFGYPYQAEDGREDLDAEGCRVVRGGSWHDLRILARAPYRHYYLPGSRRRYLGFRVCIVPQQD